MVLSNTLYIALQTITSFQSNLSQKTSWYIPTSLLITNIFTRDLSFLGLFISDIQRTFPWNNSDEDITYTSCQKNCWRIKTNLLLSTGSLKMFQREGEAWHLTVSRQDADHHRTEKGGGELHPLDLEILESHTFRFPIIPVIFLFSYLESQFHRGFMQPFSVITNAIITSSHEITF